jgi:hypothetical protein
LQLNEKKMKLFPLKLRIRKGYPFHSYSWNP